MVVYILNCQGKPLMPCSPRVARKLLKSGKAKVLRRTPFTLKLLHHCADRVQIVVAGMDTGAETIGTAAIANGKSLYQSEMKLRSKEIKSKMQQRAMYRRTRRNRKTAYRKPRFLNRRNSIKLDRLPPSVKHVIHAHLREKSFIKSILPVAKWTVETASFDIHKITNPDVSKEHGQTYQQGRQKDFYNVKAYVLNRDGYTCQKCKNGKRGTKLHVHHIIFRSNGGTDSPDNLVTLCEKCHSKVHALKNGEAEKISNNLKTKIQKLTASATKISIVKTQLEKLFGQYTETFGYVTKFNRESQNLPKAHHIDATCIASQGEIIKTLPSIFVKRCVSKGDYQQTSGARSEKRIPTGKLFGLRKFDFIQTAKGAGFVKGKRSSGYFSISTILGEEIHASVNVKINTVRKQSRKTILIQGTQFLPVLKDEVSLRELQ